MSHDSTFPGVGALPTVMGTLLVLHGTTGAAETPLHRLLGLAPLQTLGRLSHSIYLWHWPFLVFGAALIPFASVWHRMGLVIASAIVAELSFRFVESPLRHHAWLSVSPRRSLAAAILVTLAMAGIGAGWKFQANRWSQALDVKGGAWDASMASWPIRTQSAEETSAVPVILGAPDGRERWVLLGDSHAEVWYPALATLLAPRGVQLVLFTKAACPAMLQRRRSARLDYAACDAWRLDALRQISEMHPAVLLISSREEQPFPDHAWVAATQALLAGLNGSVAEVVILRGLATGPSRLPECLEAATWRGADGNDVCTLRTDPVDQGGYATVKRALGGQPELIFEDWSDLFCVAGSCNPRTRSGEPLYWDSNHLSRLAVLEAVPGIEARLVATGLLAARKPAAN